MSGSRAIAALAALLVVVTALGPAVGAVAASPDAVATVDSHNDTESADEAYVTDGGDVVLVYEYDDDGAAGATAESDSGTAQVTTIEVEDDEEEYESEEEEYESEEEYEDDEDESEDEEEYEKEDEYEPEEPESVDDYGESAFENAEFGGHAGVNVTAGLAHVVAEADGIESNVTGDGTVWVTEEGVTANATVSVPTPEALESLTLDAEMVDTLEERSSSLSVDATVALPENGTVLALVERVHTSGTTTTTPTTFQSNGTLVVETGLPLETDRSNAFTLTQADGGYTLDAAAEYSPENASDWDTRETARSTLEERFCSNATECTVSVDSYTFDDGRLDVEYTVTLPAAADRITEMVRTGLGSDEGVDDATAEAVADHLENASVERIAADLSVADGDGQLTYNVSVAGTDDLVLAGATLLEVAENASAETMTGQASPMAASPGEAAERLRSVVEARAAADATETRTWDATFTTDNETATVDATVESDAPQWAAYVEELTDRGINVTGARKASLTAETDGDRLVVDAESTYTEEGWIADRLSSLPAEMNETVATVEATEFDRARADWELTESSARVEAAVAVENASALRAELPDAFGEVDAVYTDFDEERTTVRLNDAVDADADEEAVRELALVGEDTEVTLAEDHDREFQAMNQTHVRSFLGLPTDEGDDGISPVAIAAGVAAVGAVGGAGLLARRYW